MFQCRRIIYNLIALESKNESLYPLNTGQRVKGQKREDQYKAMWNELETLLKKNLHTADHRNIYNCLLECHKFNFDEEKLSEKVELDEALRELDHIGAYHHYFCFFDNVYTHRAFEVGTGRPQGVSHPRHHRLAHVAAPADQH